MPDEEEQKAQQGYSPDALPPLPEGVEYARSPLELEPEARGPEGTVPEVRPDIDELLTRWGDRVPQEPEHIFDVLEHPTPAGNHRYYAVREAGPGYSTTGMEGRISLWWAALAAPPNPIPPGNDTVGGDTSIMQIWLTAGDYTGKQLDALEAGKYQSWSVDPAARRPKFFASFTNSAYKDPDPDYCKGGFVGLGASGWHPWLLATWSPNMYIPDSQLSTIGGTYKVLYVQWTKVIDSFGNATWNLSVNGTLSGWFAQSCVEDGVSKTMWHPSNGTGAAGLRSFGTDAQWGGEVNDSQATCVGAPPTCTGATETEMGNGLFVSDPNSAWIDHMYVRDGAGTNTGLQQIPGVYQNRSTQDSACYNQSGVVNNGFYLGGSGYQAFACH